MAAMTLVLLWGLVLDFCEWRILRRALFGPIRGASAAGIFRGHFRSAVCGPWRSRRLAIHLAIFGGAWCLRPESGTVAIATVLSLLFACARTDNAGGSIPAGLVYLGLAAGLAFSLLNAANGTSPAAIPSLSIWNALSQAVTDGLLATATLFWIAVTFEALFRREGLGLGDVQLAAVLGLFFGLAGALRVFFLGAVLALSTWCGQFLIQSQNCCRLRLGQPLPFVPYLLAGATCQALLLFFT
ncbi:MAG: A24 family peptidase [Puniceicoccales bacterium]|nr:A24 family peptidase [Puniceicoccales bacterium]